MSEVATMDQMALVCESLGFSYPDVSKGAGDGGAQTAVPHMVLKDVSFSVPEGAFALLTGLTGSGKTTLLRLAKPEVAPVGMREGSIRVFGKDVADMELTQSALAIGYVFQSPDNQIVCDTVWHELAFGLENLGIDEGEMRLRLAETCQFLGMEHIFRMRCQELSGGQRQLVALASSLVMRPRLLLMDEPTSQLDPIAEKDFLSLLFRINQELGVTILVATHRPGPMAAYATHAFSLTKGGAVEERPLSSYRATARERGTTRLHDVDSARAQRLSKEMGSNSLALKLEDVWYRYARDAQWVLRGCDFAVREGEVRAVMGGNGSGKSTLLALAAGALKQRRGKVTRPFASSQALLPQSPRALLACETVLEELVEWQDGKDAAKAAQDVLDRLGLGKSLGRHPLDLSLGQQQLLALEKLFLTQPKLLFLDEPTKGLDDDMRAYVMKRVGELARAGATIIVATHDIEFVRDACDTVTLLFDGQSALTTSVQSFSERSWVYGRSL